MVRGERNSAFCSLFEPTIVERHCVFTRCESRRSLIGTRGRICSSSSGSAITASME